MKKRLKRTWTCAAALTLALLMASGPAALASVALGTEISSAKVNLGQGVDYTSRTFWSATYSDQRVEHYLEYTPNAVVQPAVSFGNYVVSNSTLTTMAKTLEAQGKRVLGGINGDYYVLATGAPLGMVITDGILRSSSADVYALGFDAAGNAFIGLPYLSIAATFHGTKYNVGGGFNKVRDAAKGYVLYSSDFYSSTYHSSSASGVDVILTPSTANQGQTVEGNANLVYTSKPIVNGRLTCTVDQVLHSTGSIKIPAGKLVLTVNNQSDAGLVNALASLQAGETVSIDISAADSRWASAVTSIGGLYKMVTNGVVASGLETTAAPRTAVGIRPDGSCVFYTIDGRQAGYSIGASMTQVANRLVELGCTEAICLDGGGSTTFGVTLPGGNNFGVVNRPSDGSQRAVANALYLVQTAPGIVQNLRLSPNTGYVMPGAVVSFSADGIDVTGQAIQHYAGSELSFASSNPGTAKDGVFTFSKDISGTVSVSASAGGITGTAQFTVVTTPDSITVKDQETGSEISSISVKAGGQVRLTAAAAYQNQTLLYRDESFTWSVTDGMGSIDQSGVFTASENGGVGFITVSAGDRSVSIPLTVAGHVNTVENFEGSLEQMTDSAAAQVKKEVQLDYVRYGSQSARIVYNIGQEEFASVGIPLTFPLDEMYISMWVYGDGSGNTLAACFYTEDGQQWIENLTELNFTGWKQIVTPLPERTAGVQELTVMQTGTTTAGTIWLDHITTANQIISDTVSPTVMVQQTGNTVTADLLDNLDTDFKTEQIRVTYDGLPLDFTLTGTAVSVQLPTSDGAAHRVTITVTDASGNIGRGSADIAAAGSASPFADIAGDWSESYVNYLYSQEIAKGVEVGEKLLFQPNKAITRGEFALMLARWLRADLSQYSEVELPFADADAIPSWCLDGMKAMYALEIMQGSLEGDASYAYAEQSISRAEVMTMLGRIQPKGHVAKSLTFTDAALVPAWAADHVKVLTGLGVVGGYDDGTVQPNASITRGEVAKILYTLR